MSYSGQSVNLATNTRRRTESSALAIPVFLAAERMADAAVLWCVHRLSLFVDCPHQRPLYGRTHASPCVSDLAPPFHLSRRKAVFPLAVRESQGFEQRAVVRRS